MSLSNFKVITKVRDHVSCKNCSHLTKEKLNGKYCKDLGILEVSETCASFRPNVQELRKLTPAVEVTDLFKAIRALPDSMLPIVASLLARESKTRTFTAFKILQPVMVVIEGEGNYMSDYCRAYVLDADKEYVRVINKEGTIIAQFPLDSTSVLTGKQFKVRKLTMLPGTRTKSSKTTSLSLDEAVPTIDSNPDDNVSVKKLRKDLVMLFAAANNR